MATRRIIKVRAPALYLLIGMIGGLIGANLWTVEIGWLLSGATAFSIGAIRQTQSPRIWALTYLIACIFAFWAYGSIRLPHQPNESALSRPPRETMLTIKVQRLMQADSQFGTTSGIAQVLTAPPHSRLKNKAQVYFRFKDDARIIQRGIQLKVTGVLTPILEYDEDGFEDYLKSIAVHYRFERNGAIQVVRPPSQFDQFCQNMNQRLQNYLQLGEPAESDVANVYSAMLLGRKAELSAAQTERYRMTGTMHFFAISGLHIGVIATVIAQFLILIRVPRPLNPLIGLPLLYLYVEITGASPSAVRAFLMAMFFWASFAFQRQRNPFAALVGSAIFVLIIQPTQLWSIGFQLSYSVVISILLFGLPLHQLLSSQLQLFRWLPKDAWTPAHHAWAWAQDKLTLLFAISFSAWLASTPLSAGLFGFIAPGAILLNMLLVNLAALVISGGVIAMASGLTLHAGICAFINHSAWVVITAIDSLVILFTRIPGAILPCQSFPITASYLSLGIYFVLLMWHHHNMNNAKEWRILCAPAALALVVLGGYLSQ